MPDSGGVAVCCEHGIISHDGSSNLYYVPIEKYVVVLSRTRAYLSRKLVLARKFNLRIQKTISYSEYVAKEQDPSTPSGLRKKK
jgi:hypothetical protein